MTNLHRTHPISVLLMVLFLGFFLTACQAVKVQQGNLLPQSRVERLKVGMTKEEVVRVMGTSLLMTPFSDNHWDYAYTTRVGYEKIKKKSLVLDFEDNKLTHISSNDSN